MIGKGKRIQKLEIILIVRISKIKIFYKEL